MLHTGLSPKHWFSLSINEQMANIGSEVERAIKWKDKNTEYSNLANNRALELFDLTLDDAKYHDGIKEVTRARELWLDFFLGDNQYHQTAVLWHKYFNAFTYAARNL
jgi:hypothetical protein